MSDRRVSARGRGKFLSPGSSPEDPQTGRNEEPKNSSRVKMNLLVREDLAERLKIYAVRHRVRLYQAIEKALVGMLDNES